MRITLVIGSLSGGGAERVMSILADYWAQSGESVTLITLTDVSEDFYKLDPRVRRIGLGLTKVSHSLWDGIRNNIRRVAALRRAIHASQPDCVLSFIDQTNVLSLAACWGLGIPVIASEHIDPRQMNIGKLWNILRRWLYPRAAAVVVLTENVRSWAEGLAAPKAARVIANPIPNALLQSVHTDQAGAPGLIIAAMGRLVRQKGFDVLLKAFARSGERHPDWSLMILGEGPERSQLESLAWELGIGARVSFPGLIQNPFRMLRRTSMFVLSSRFEGFPMALIEAMACGLPVISTDCPSGPRDIIRDGVDALLVPTEDVSALAEAMSRLMGDPAERERLAARAVEVIDRFGVNSVMRQWDALLAEVTQRPGCGSDAAGHVGVSRKHVVACAHGVPGGGESTPRAQPGC